MLSIGYAALSSGLTTADRVGTGSGLTSSSWNRIVNGVLELDTRTAPISSSGGNIGIGTASPGAKLDIAGNVNFYSPDGTTTATKIYRPIVAYADQTFNHASLYLGGSDNGYGLAMGIRNDNKVWLQAMVNNAAAGAGPILLAPDGGNVGIGTASPGAKLDVAGDIRATAGGTIGVTRISGTWGSTTTNIPNATWTYIGDNITLTPGNWIVNYSSFYDNDGTAFTSATYVYPSLSSNTNNTGLVSYGNLSMCPRDYCPFNQTYQINVASTTTYYIVHMIVNFGGSYVRIRGSQFGNFYAIKVN